MADTPQNKKKIDSLNTLKGLACIGVIFMHSVFPGTLGKIVLYLFKFNVPCFLLISGYFLYSNDSSQIASKATIQMIKIVKMIGVCFIAYGLIDLFQNCIYKQGGSFSDWFCFIFDITYLPRRIFCGTFFNETLWYLYAVAWAYLIIILFSKNKKEKLLFYSMPFLFALHLISRIYVKKQGFEWYDYAYWRTSILYAIPFMMIGYGCAKYKTFLVSLKNSILLILVIGGFTLQFIEYSIYKQSLDFYVGTILYSSALFLLAIKYPYKKFCNALNHLGEKLSMTIYLTHMALLIFIRILSIYFGGKTSEGTYLEPILLMILCILTSQLIYCMEKKN